MAFKSFIVAMLLAMVLIVAGCRGDGHTDHDHHSSWSPAAPAR